MPMDCAPSSADTLRPEPFRIGDDLALLTEVRRPGVHAVHVRRALPPDLLSCAATLAVAAAGGVEVRLRADRTDPTPLFEGLPDLPGRRTLEADVATLMGRFLALTRAEVVRAELSIVAHDKCRKYHADYVGLRLLCTYAGPGTEWVEEEAVDRAALDHAEVCVDTCNARIVRSARVHHCLPGDVVVLKGHQWPGNDGFGVVHRSPPIEARGARRLVLTLTSP